MASKAYPRSYTVGTSPMQIMPPSPTRIGVIIGQPAAGHITISPAADVTDLSGMIVAQGGLPLQLRKCDYGCLVQGPLYAIADAAGRTGSIIEIEGDGKP